MGIILRKMSINDVQAPAQSASKTSSPIGIVIVASLMLFSMFFGAGNLIFPPEVGVSSGTNFWPATLGFPPLA